MEELYENLKIIDYSLICFVNKYKIIDKYIKHILDIFGKIIDEYNTLIHKVINVYKQNVYNSVHNSFLEFKTNEENQNKKNKEIHEIKNTLKKAIKLTKTNINFNDNNQDNQDALEFNTNIKISFPYNTLALYKLRYYRNLFFKKYSTITKNDNYLNANYQRKRFLEKLKLSAKNRQNQKNDIFKDDYKNMQRILKENYFFKESNNLKDILVITKYLNKAKNIINNIPYFLYTIMEEFETSGSTFQENMYLFVLLALNMWLKKITQECERFISDPKTKGKKCKKEKENEKYKIYKEYLYDIIQRGAEQTEMFNDDKVLFYYPSNMKFNVNTSFLTYHFLYINKNLFNFIKKKIKIKKGQKEIQYNTITKIIEKINYKEKDDSAYMKNDIYNYNLYNEYVDLYSLINLSFKIDNENIYPNIFLIKNYMHEEAKNIIDIIYKLQNKYLNLIIYQDVSIIIQLILYILDNLKMLSKKECQQNFDDYSSESKKYISNIKCNYLNMYSKILFPIRLTFLNILKFVHNILKTHKWNYICTFWSKIKENKFDSHTDTNDTTKHNVIDENKKGLGIKNEENCSENGSENCSKNSKFNYLPLLLDECNEDNCYNFNKKKKKKNTYNNFEANCELAEQANFELAEQANFELAEQAKFELAEQRMLCFDFYKIVNDNLKNVKIEIENKNNRDIYTGISLKKKNKYKIDKSPKANNYMSSSKQTKTKSTNLKEIQIKTTKLKETKLKETQIKTTKLKEAQIKTTKTINLANNYDKNNTCSILKKIKTQTTLTKKGDNFSVQNKALSKTLKSNNPCLSKIKTDNQKRINQIDVQNKPSINYLNNKIVIEKQINFIPKKIEKVGNGSWVNTKKKVATPK
ncbi:hypothetical protein YYC_02490 [Plasmodium yoelii 17X]|uniref:Uncharacterized protein n=2 Tax=Plasmodium yoelii 17X TaxID=1323249 RepID=V7PP97_PLAYE|nr:hypothetical protein YYC_02490 [Plasmodium yoelii 17X]